MCKSICAPFVLLLALGAAGFADPQMRVGRLLVTDEEGKALFNYRFNYDTSGRIVQIDWLGPEAVLWLTTRRYFDAAGNMVLSVSSDGNGTLSTIQVRTLDDSRRLRQSTTYDGNGRLISQVAYKWTEQDQVVLRAGTAGTQAGSAARMRRVKGSIFDAEMVDASVAPADGAVSVKSFLEHGILVRTELLYANDRLPVQKRVFAYLRDGTGRLTNVQISDFPSRRITNQLVEWQSGPVLGDSEDELLAWMHQFP